MSTLTLEERITALEMKLEHLQKQSQMESTSQDKPWWEQIRGKFKDDPAYDEAMRLGREYRESLPPKEDEEIEC